MNVLRALKRRLDRSLTLRLAVTIAVLHAALMTLVVVDLLDRERDMLATETRTALMEEATLLARSGREWLLARDLAGMEELLQSLRTSPGIEYAMYLDRDGRVLAHTEDDKTGMVLADAVSQQALSHADAGTARVRLIQSSRELSDALAPVRYGDRLVGWVRVARNHEREQLALDQLKREGALYVLVAIVLGVFAASLFARRLTTDLRSAQVLFRRVREGDLSQRLELRRSDELGELMGGINDTLDALSTQEQDLRLTRERLELALEGANDGVWDWDLVHNTVHYSGRWKSMLGIADDIDDGRTSFFMDRVHPDDLSGLLDRVNDYLEGRLPVFDHVVRARHEDGRWIWILTRGTAQRDAQGHAYRMNGTHTDVTKLKEIEAAQALEQSRLSGLLAQMYTGVVMEDADGRIALCNQAFCRLLPIAGHPSELIGRQRSELLVAALPLFADPEATRRRIEQIVDGGEPVLGDRIELADGRVIERDCVPIRVGEMQKGRLWTIRDVSSRMRLENSLAAEKERLRVTLLSIGDAVISTGVDGCINFLNPVAEELTGWSNAEATGRPLAHVLELLDADTRLPRRRPSGDLPSDVAVESADGVALLRARNGDERVVEDSAAPIRDARGKVCGAVVVFRDVTDRHRMQEQLRWQATHDPLTGLANRLLLEDRMNQAMARARRHERQLAVCMLDLDEFKSINDQQGHDAGDAVLLTMAQRLKEAVREDDTVARLGGDEFVVLLGELSGADEMHDCLARILKAVSEPVTVHGRTLSTRASIGVTLYPTNASDADTLLRHADQAMYASKQSGGNGYRVFDFAHSQASVERLRRKERVGEAVAGGEMRLYYQPRIDMHAGRMVSVEALVRWLHPDEGLLPPDSFLPLIENDPEINRLGEWVIKTALEQMTQWRAEGASFGVSVNISAPHLLTPGFVARLSDLLAEWPDVPRDLFEIEVVESVALDDIERAANVVGEVRALGVRVAIDDFGVGYASLGYLRRLPVDVVKIDKSFVLDMLDDEDDLEVVQAVIALAHTLRRESVAEGVETLEHALLLLRLGCHLVQGYGISRPMPPSDLLAWNAAWTPDPRWRAWRGVRWDLDDLPLFTAEREFRRWVDQLLRLAEDGSARRPGGDVRDPSACAFGQWFYGAGRARYGSFEEYRVLEARHSELHDLGGRILDCVDAGDLSGARPVATTLRAVRDQVSSNIDALQRVAGRRCRID
jgi:diguanylate cyclase (GGDEF)-like protein/PAS domain S-box-containing protein